MAFTRPYYLQDLRKVATSVSMQKLSLFFSSMPSPGSSIFFSDDPQGGSAVYRHALKFQRPTSLKWTKQLCNSVSLIGSIEQPFKMYESKNGGISGYTLLNVKESGKSNRTFRILLQMLDDMAKLSVEHLKPNDFIYVSGQLRSRAKADLRGNIRTYYKSGQGPTPKRSDKESESGLEKRINRIRLWQVFFANPHEWWDNRKDKKAPNRPDFKHKDTGECLWISRNDPPWVKRQLELYDLEVAGGFQGSSSHVSGISKWEYDD